MICANCGAVITGLAQLKGRKGKRKILCLKCYRES